MRVGLEAHHRGQMLLGDTLEIGRVVERGEGVLLPAELGDDLGRTRPPGAFSVPLNIRCSRKCAMPETPIGSSAEPLRYQTMWVATGTRVSGTTTTSMPLSSL